MFDVAPTELLLVAVVAVVVIGPKDLPKAMRIVGYWVGRARGVARQFRSGFDEMIREAEFAEMEKKWAEENARIMRDHPPAGTAALPAPEAEPAAAETIVDMAPVMTERPAIVDQPTLFDEPPPRPEVVIEHPVVEPGHASASTEDAKAPS